MLHETCDTFKVRDNTCKSLSEILNVIQHGRTVNNTSQTFLQSFFNFWKENISFSIILKNWRLAKHTFFYCTASLCNTDTQTVLWIRQGEYLCVCTVLFFNVVLKLINSSFMRYVDLAGLTAKIQWWMASLIVKRRRWPHECCIFTTLWNEKLNYLHP